tara:strand:+ start:8216 stop:8662 length:447 start_codon:yes stop_codon:yes gene_type:complete
MKIRACLLMPLLLVSQNLLAGTVHIFTNDAHPVVIDVRLPRDVIFPIRNLDEMNRAEARLNTAVKRLAEQERSGTTPERYEKAFNRLLNSPEWTAHDAAFGAGSKPIIEAIQMRVQKLPAIVFDEKYVVYGVTSLAQAVRLYQREVQR